MTGDVLPGGAVVEFRVPPLGVEVEAIGGRYVFVRQGVLGRDEGEILYLVGCAVTDRSCCGQAGCAFVLVAGFLRSRLDAHDERGGPCVGNETVTVECIPDRMRKGLAEALKAMEPVGQVHFLLAGGGTDVFF
ncbi:MAG TPA: hypothetical protein PLS81_11455 [Deltaproteobacteria bacterium]|nr:hypothetical protein [Deltaproteobacteria bacterium]HPP79469.1 hypothetical protein [Deltaproteobacteria bacterium]